MYCSNITVVDAGELSTRKAFGLLKAAVVRDPSRGHRPSVSVGPVGSSTAESRWKATTSPMISRALSETSAAARLAAPHTRPARVDA